jgi:hypothetical protein
VQVERERGITIEAQSASLVYQHTDGQLLVLLLLRLLLLLLLLWLCVAGGVRTNCCQ